MISSLLLLAAVAAGPLEVQATPLAGPAVQGQLIELSSDQAALRTPQGIRRLAVHNLLKITVSSPPPPGGPSPSAWIDLADDSRLLAAGYSTSNGTARIQWLGGGEARIPVALVRSVRWAKENDSLERQWRAIVESGLQGDAIVVRRTSAALDHWEGVLYDVGPEAVQFQLDDQRASIPRTKLEGIIYYRAIGRATAAPICRVADTDGSIWNVRALELAPAGVQLTTAAGALFQLPPPRIREFDFSAGNVVYLSDLEPASVRWTPYLPSAAADRLAQLFEPRRDRALDGGKLMLGGAPYDKGLAIHSRTELVYRLTDDFRRLRAVVGIDDRVREEGDVRLVISGDGRTLLEQTVAGRDPPRQIDLDIAGVRRLGILVDFGENLDIADHLDLCDARMLK